MVAVLWIVCVLKGLAYLSANPAFEGFDEPWHYGYIQEIREQGRLPGLDTSRLSRELERSFACLPTPFNPESLPRHETYWSLSAEERLSMQQALRAIPMASRAIPSSIEQYEAQQPPLYYLLCAPVYWIMEGRDLLEILFACRLFSVLLASLTVPLGYAALRRWFAGHPHLALAVPAVVVFMPVFYFDTSRVGNDALGVPLFTALLWACGTFWREDWQARRTAVMGILLGLGLLTKAYFLSALPPVIALFALKWIYQRPTAKTFLGQLLLFGLVAACAGGWWYLRNLIVYGSFSGLIESFHTRDQDTTSWISALREMSLHRFYRSVLDHHLWPGNWSFLKMPPYVERAFRYLFLIGLLAFLVKTAAGFAKSRRRAWDPSSMLVLLFYATFLCAMLYHTLQAWAMHGQIMTGGWYLCAMIVIEVAMLVLGYRFLLRGPVKGFRIDVALLVFFAVIDLWGFFFRLIPFYTGYAEKDGRGGLVYGTLEGDSGSFIVTVLDRLAWNKPAWIARGTLTVLFCLSILAAMLVPLCLWRLGPEPGETERGKENRGREDSPGGRPPP